MLWSIAVVLKTQWDTQEVVICILLVVAIATLLVNVLINIDREHHTNRETMVFHGNELGRNK